MLSGRSLLNLPLNNRTRRLPSGVEESRTPDLPECFRDALVQLRNEPGDVFAALLFLDGRFKFHGFSSRITAFSPYQLPWLTALG